MKLRKTRLFLSCILLICLVFSLTSCNNKKTSPNKPPTKNDPDATTDSPDKITEKGIPIEQYDRVLKAELSKDNKLELEKFDWNICAFQLDNVTYSVPFSYSRIMDEWTFDLVDYGLDSTFQLEPLTKTSGNVVLKHESRPYTLTVGFYNPYRTPISLDKAKIWSWEIDITTQEMDKRSIENDTVVDPNEVKEESLPLIKPNILFPKNVEMHASIASILLAYGEPKNNNIHNSENGYYEFHYELNYNIFLTLTLDEKEGLVKAVYKHFPKNTLTIVPQEDQK